MYSQPGKKMSRNSSFILDLVHIVIGLAIVVLAVISFLNPNEMCIRDRYWEVRTARPAVPKADAF